MVVALAYRGDGKLVSITRGHEDHDEGARTIELDYDGGLVSSLVITSHRYTLRCSCAAGNAGKQ
jgi:hypothetical protein